MKRLLPPPHAKEHSEWQELPPVISESLIHKFMYWDQHVKVGMRYGHELYTLLQSYSTEERLKACDLGCAYQQQGIGVCLTASKTTYSVWLNLKSLSAIPNEDINIVHPILSDDSE